MKYYVFETSYVGRFAVEAPTYEDALGIMFEFDLVAEDEDYYFIGEATLEELDAEGLDVI